MAKRILLADDSITIQKVVELTFSDGDYQVTAVNNGTKAIQKLSEMRPDIILSDIIMPEKNGYEVCEYVKSHPEFRTIPVILLTGTFEPFDPDRADKAGCDAVVTKPFESQSLIHKVEELIEAAGSQPAQPAPSEPAAPAESPFAPPPDTFATTAFPAQGSDIFGTPSATAPADTPFDTSAPAEGETKAFPRMSFDELQKMANEPAQAATPPPPSPPEPSPWDEQPPATEGETRAFPKMSFEEMPPPAQAAPPPPEPSPWEETPATGGETKAFPRMGFDELQQMANAPSAAPPEPPPAQPAAPEPSPWDSAPSESAAAGDAATPFAETTPAEEPPSSSPWDETPAETGGETKAFPRMSFEELQQPATPAVAAPPAAEESAFTPPEEAPAAPALSEPAASEPPSAAQAGELSDAQIDRIARRVVELMSEQVVKNIAWEVIPDMAEMVVKERIRQLESEA